MSATKTCSRCEATKPLGAFYRNANGTHGRMPYCKKCDNARPRKVTAIKINRTRARHRAVADLIAAHEAEFTQLLEARLTEAHIEADVLAATPQAAEHFTSEPVRLRPGPRMTGEQSSDRIDVARCPDCAKHHDRGHKCPNCGVAPTARHRRKSDGILDEVAIERAMAGDTVALTSDERDEAIRRLVDAGISDHQIGQRLHVTDRTILRRRQAMNLESRWTA